MNYYQVNFSKTFFCFFFIIFSTMIVPNCVRGAEAKDETTTLLRRIDFGNSYIMGQSIKSGAVYLLQRKKSNIKSMLHYRESYRQEILEDFTLIDMRVENGAR